MKISRSNKKIPILVLYLTISSCIMWACNSQKERVSRWDLDADFEAMKNFDNEGILSARTLCASSNTVEDCEDERDGFAYNMQLMKRQPGHNAALTNAFTASKADKSIRTVPVFQTNQALSCSCEIEHRLLDLGILYYPRYVPTAVCKPGGCHGGSYRCHPKKYKVRVLKQKQLEDADRIEANPAILPESLKDLFLSETITVTVACECAP